METTVNSRGYTGKTFYRRHLNLTDLKTEAETAALGNQYLAKVGHQIIPPYPRPEFHVSHLKHETGGDGLTGIRSDSGFRAFPNKDHEDLVWWSLYVTPEDIQSAERRLLDKQCPERTEEQAQMQQPFLGKFASSPAFLESSRLGSYRFIFPLDEVLDTYREQFCSGKNPMMRVWSTTLYKQEVMYAVLVHSPANEQLFSEYPLLTDEPDSICAFRDGCFIWRPEAMCETHRFELIEKCGDNQMEAVEPEGRHEFYVWDHVAIALHVTDEAVLTFDSDHLRANLRFCEMGDVVIKRSQYSRRSENFDSYEEAQARVTNLWPLERSPRVQ
ncbi:uncharacterized protein LOC115433520 [Sphaeramia orbicularis]|uniref:uncharacterized protein LOC115433520 n=1 Tax=Sphaeramia orbicularis TaxID=375764 RepID=UPI00117D5ECC|nr:uncharacterized protein LOC115433520 [Sphaeramia orbicularis]